MARLSCGVTLTLLGVLLLGAARPPGGAGECGAPSAEVWGERTGSGRREGRRGPRVQSWGGASVRTDGADSPGPPDSRARSVGREGRDLLGSGRSDRDDGPGTWECPRATSPWTGA